MGICSSKPDHTVIKKRSIVCNKINQTQENATERNVIPIDSSYVLINVPANSLLPSNKTTRYNGLGSFCDTTDELFIENNLQLCVDTHKTNGRGKKSRIPVAARGPKKLDDQCGCKDRTGDIIVKQDWTAGDKSTKGQNGKRSTIDRTSYTVAIGKNKPQCKSNVIHVKQVPAKKQPVFKQSDRLLLAQMNRQKQLKARVEKARQYKIKKQDIEERRLAMSAELKDKLLKKQERRELAIVKEHIEERLETFKQSVGRARFYSADHDKKYI